MEPSPLLLRLPPRSIRHFSADETLHSNDPALLASIRAAERYAQAEGTLSLYRQSTGPGLTRGTEDPFGDMASDSDGGWGVTQSLARGGRGGRGGRRGRGGRGRGGFGRGGRWIRRRGIMGEGEEEEPGIGASVPEAEALPPSAEAAAASGGYVERGAPAVEAILGWRYPDQIHSGGPAGTSGMEEPEPEYLVKYQGRSHAHNEWLPEVALLKSNKRKLANFRRRFGEEPCCFMKEEWTVPERFISRQPCPHRPGWQVLVKWTGFDYNQCTWETEGEGESGMGRKHRSRPRA